MIKKKAFLFYNLLSFPLFIVLAAKSHCKNEYLTHFQFFFFFKEACTELLLPEACPLCSGLVNSTCQLHLFSIAAVLEQQELLPKSAVLSKWFGSCYFQSFWFLKMTFHSQYFSCFFLLSPHPNSLRVWNSVAAWKGENSSYPNIRHKKVQRNEGWQR